MDWFELAALLTVVAAVASYLNTRFLRLPTTIGLMVIGLLSSLTLIAVGNYEPAIEAGVVALLERIDFNETLMHGMLGFLLFAAALHVDIADLAEQRLVITAM